MKFDIINGFAGKVQFTAEIECADDAPTSVKLGLAVKVAVKIGVNLSGANLSRADLSRADLGGVNLSYADLSCADLSGADLSRANLSCADLSGQWIIQGTTRSDGYAFFLQKLKSDAEPMVKAGCRYFTLAEAEAHWNATRGGTALFRETEIIVRAMVDLAYARGLMTAPTAQAAE